MKKQLLLFVVMMLPMVASADAVEIDGIYYNLITNDCVAEVTQNPNDYTGSITIPESVTYNNVNYSVTRIGEMAFSYCSSLTSVTIGNSVTRIGNFAFRDCSGLTSVTIGNSVTSIGEEAFRDCSGLTSVTIGNSVKTIGEEAFRGCSGLTSITIPNSVTSIERHAFQGCSGLTSVHISDLGAWCIISFGIYANPLENAHHLFLNGEEIKDLVIPNSVTRIEDYVFYDCSSLTSVTIPNSVTSIGNSAFYGCSGLTSVTIPNSVTSIYGWAFEGCSGLTSVTIPSSVTSIGRAAFKGCSGLTSISVENGNTVYDSRNNCNAIIETISNTLESGCKNTIIPNSVTTIGDDAFWDCSGLTSVTIPNSVTSIGDWTFCGCSGLTSVTSLNPTPPALNSTSFNSYTATLNVPTGSKAAYQAADYWKNFTNITEIDATGVKGIHVDSQQNAIVYDLNGRKLVAPTKGVTIVNGRKVIMK